MPVDIFRCRVDHNISTQQKRLLQIRSCKSIVTYHFDLRIICMGDLSRFAYICYFEIRIDRCLEINDPGPFVKYSSEFVFVVKVDESYFDAESAQMALKEFKSASIKSLVSYYLFTAIDACPYCRRYCTHT